MRAVRKKADRWIGSSRVRLLLPKGSRAAQAATAAAWSVSVRSREVAGLAWKRGEGPVETRVVHSLDGAEP